VYQLSMSPINDDYECYIVAVIVVIATSVILSMSTYYKRWTLEDCNTSFSLQHHQDKVVAKNDFLQRVGSRYGYANSKKGFIDNWRQLEFPTLIPPLSSQQQDDSVTSPEEEQEVYLDYAGSALPTSTLLSHVSNINTQILANPHSVGGGVASDRTLKLMQLSKDHVMKHFGIDKESFGLDELDNDTDNTTTCPGYQLVFTSGATDSLRLLSERFPWNCVKVSATQGSYMTSFRDCNNLQSRRQLKSIQMQSILLYPRNVHTSVIGMREVAIGRDAKFHCTPIDELLTATSEWFESLIETSITYEDYSDDEKIMHESREEEKKDECGISPPNQATNSLENQTEEICKTIWIHHLLVLPIECNFSGDRFDWNSTTTLLKSSCFSSYLDCAEYGKIQICHKWHILLDIAKSAATSQVHLPTIIPGADFAAVSFYKMFGAPTGLGALFVKKQHRKSKRNITQTNEFPQCCLVEQNASPRHFFGGGSVDVVLPGKDFVVTRNASLTVSTTNDNEHIDIGAMEHGTRHFRGIASLSHGFQELDDFGGMEAVSSDSSIPFYLTLIHHYSLVSFCLNVFMY